ncbi:NAD-dependent epimerase/dehydratase family protein [Myxococcus llanfairpwllgwyngyllgogerychwyrndrobwllllantysiliogogogochensis]|uniref:NAD-dependent epimerase/dehydratase family protein n=1 Tax=Myxococcus llanfairpwllgwyngyllgogerychwyrndrobwllllantysiliogogogochensis TaxID=2590453 RepID=A0A540WXB3_9BACT|nr:NAD(P)H-binding protein [Myxococcus llanfairpwllgwyngyllgogerychwyrndrobwllllantysiliogogogochensis]TQF13643.1 NAD-dependent epimerase/dehydratase family protein [Myxococcus llanfairpwllgwyngyllgogerychwyrndrobwllllantysiliogogogochensis]
MLTVMGATGNTGKKVVELLLAAGQDVRALGRSESRLAELAARGAQVLVGDPGDAAFLAKAFAGAEAVYTLLPADRESPDYHGDQRRKGEAIVQALRDSGVRHVVALSSLGAEQREGTGLLATLHAQEERLKTLEDTNVLLLRPVSFFENFFDALAVIEHQGVNADSVDPDLAVPMIATRDIADVAAKAMLHRDWKGLAIRELLGPRDLSYREATRILGARLGKPGLEYVRLAPAEMTQALVQAGMSETFAGLYVEMTLAFNEGRVRPRAGRTAHNTTPTRFEDFVEELALAATTK